MIRKPFCEFVICCKVTDFSDLWQTDRHWTHRQNNCLKKFHLFLNLSQSVHGVHGYQILHDIVFSYELYNLNLNKIWVHQSPRLTVAQIRTQNEILRFMICLSFPVQAYRSLHGFSLAPSNSEALKIHPEILKCRFGSFILISILCQLHTVL